MRHFQAEVEHEYQMTEDGPISDYSGPFSAPSFLPWALRDFPIPELCTCGAPSGVHISSPLFQVTSLHVCPTYLRWGLVSPMYHSQYLDPQDCTRNLLGTHEVLSW